MQPRRLPHHHKSRRDAEPPQELPRRDLPWVEIGLVASIGAALIACAYFLIMYGIGAIVFLVITRQKLLRKAARNALVLSGSGIKEASSASDR